MARSITSWLSVVRTETLESKSYAFCLPEKPIPLLNLGGVSFKGGTPPLVSLEGDRQNLGFCGEGDYHTENALHPQLGDTITQVQQREKYYNSLPSYCGTNVMFQPGKSETLFFMGCNRLSCPRCRPKIKKKVIQKVIETAIDYNLQRELILTCPGNEWRVNHSPDMSFKWLNGKFREFKILYQRETGKKLSYIKLPRSQKSGYCHAHILVNTYIKKSLIENIIKRIGLGSNYKMLYRDLHRLGSYLKNDLYKEHEWFIPVGMRHVSSSMELKEEGKRVSIFIMWSKSNGCWISIIFGKYIPPHKKYDFVYDVMQNYADHPPPHWFFLYCFTDMLRINDYADSMGYVGEYKKYYLPSSVPNSIVAGTLPAYNYQMELTGRLHRITTMFAPEKYTHQKKFRRADM
jgi:hypothetical protein